MEKRRRIAEVNLKFAPGDLIRLKTTGETCMMGTVFGRHGEFWVLRYKPVPHKGLVTARVILENFEKES